MAAPAAHALLYWADTEGYAIGRSALNGSHEKHHFISLMSSLASPCGIAISGRYIYWADELKGAIGRASLTGKGAPDPTFITGASQPCGVAVYRNHLYWANETLNGSIGRANLGGPLDVRENFVPDEQATGGHDLGQPCGVAVGPSGIYWSDMIGGGVGHAGLDGTGERTLIPGGLQACGVALSAIYLYWADRANGTIGRALLDGTQANPSYITGLNSPCGIAVASHYLYVADGATIDRADLNAADPTAAVEQIVMGTDHACGVAVN